jgi:hypothetical protein
MIILNWPWRGSEIEIKKWGQKRTFDNLLVMPWWRGFDQNQGSQPISEGNLKSQRFFSQKINGGG